MIDLGFSVLPKFGSVYTFLPSPRTDGADGLASPLTVHRLHRADTEVMVAACLCTAAEKDVRMGQRHTLVGVMAQTFKR